MFTRRTGVGVAGLVLLFDASVPVGVVVVGGGIHVVAPLLPHLGATPAGGGAGRPARPFAQDSKETSKQAKNSGPNRFHGEQTTGFRLLRIVNPCSM